MSSRLLLLAAALPVALSAQMPQPYEAVEPHMGTLFRIKLYAASQAQAKIAFEAAFRRIAELDAKLSDYQPDSELNRLSSKAIHHPTPVSDDLLRVLTAAQQLSKETDGAFDITVGALTHLWREAGKSHHLPDQSAIEAAKDRCGFQHLYVNVQQRTVELDQAGMQLDAGAIAKGDAADQALLVLSQLGIKCALVAASGDLAFSDAPPDAKGWKIGLDSFDTPASAFTRVLLLADAAVSTSGSNEQHFDWNGIRYSHIIDPSSGMGLTRDITVSVVAARGIDADSYATAVSVLGPQRGLAFIQHHPGTSVTILAVENGKRSLIEWPASPSRPVSDPH